MSARQLVIGLLTVILAFALWLAWGVFTGGDTIELTL